MRRAGLDADAAAGVFLVGGASRMPLVATLLHRIVGIPPLVVEQPELVVAEGSVIAIGQRSVAEPFTLSATPLTAAAISGSTRVPQVAVAAAAVATPVARPAPRLARPVPPPSAPDIGEEGDEDEDASNDEEIADYGRYVVDSPWSWLLQPSRGFVTPGRPWRDAPIHPINLTLPAGQGYTIRARFQEPDETLFLGRQGRLLLFRSAEGLVRHLDTDDHLLAEIDGWPEVKDWFNTLAMVPDPEDQIDLEVVPYVLEYPPREWLPDVLITGRDLVAEIATAFALTDVSKLLASGSRLDQLDDIMRQARQPMTGWMAHRRMRRVDVTPVVRDWRRAIDSIDRMVLWED